MGQMVDDVKLAIKCQRAGALLWPDRRHDPHPRRSAREDPGKRLEKFREVQNNGYCISKTACPYRRRLCITAPAAPTALSTVWWPRSWTSWAWKEGPSACASVGCSVMSYDYFTCDMVQAPHGRAPAVATGLKRACPDNVVFTYQGDGDLAAIGTAETVHAATRGENITVIFVNNAIYGMTGGQMAPTTLPGQVTQTTPYGRDTNTAGYPVRVCEMLSTLDGVALAQRVTVDNVFAHINEAKKAIKKAFQNQIEGKGYSIVEVLSTCPTNWGLTPVEALQVAGGQHDPLLSPGGL